MFRLRVTFLFCFLIVLGYSQNKETDSIKAEKLEEVFVTATKTKRQLSSLPLPALVISEKEIETINAIKLTDVIDEQTGITLVSDFGGGLGIQMQGLDSQYTLILIDGAPLIGRSAGTLDLSRVTVGNIKQIEVVKGASSSLYGSEALGGVVNIITQNPKFGIKGKVNYQFQTNQTHDASATVSYKNKQFSVVGFFNHFRTNGYDLVEEDFFTTSPSYNNSTFSIKTKYHFSKNTTALISGRFFNEYQKVFATEDLKGEGKTSEWNTHIKLNHQYNNKWSSYFEFYTTRYMVNEVLNNENNELYSTRDFNQLLIRPEIRASFNLNKKNAFIAGIGWNYETLERTEFSTIPKFNAPFVYLQYDGHPIKKMNVILGARFDAHNQYKSQFSPKLALRYKINDAYSIKGSVGYGFKAPDFRQLYFDFTNPSVGYTVLGYNQVLTRIPELEQEGQLINVVVPLSEFSSKLLPENSVSYNLGGVFKPISKLTFEVNLFRNNIKDLIDTRVIANKTNGQQIFSYYNVNKVYTQGVSFNAIFKVTNYLKFSGGYQYLIAKDRNAEKAFSKGEVFARITPNSPSFQLKEQEYFGLFNRSKSLINAKVFYNFPLLKVTTNIRATYRSKYGIIDSNSNGYLDDYDDFVDGYAIVDWAVNKTFYSHFNLGFGINNMFDFTDPQSINNIPGRLIYGKLNYKF